MRAFAIRFLFGATLLLHLVPARPAETVRIAYLGAMSGTTALLSEEIQNPGSGQRRSRVPALRSSAVARPVMRVTLRINFCSRALALCKVYR
jgi:hypothetical protein